MQTTQSTTGLETATFRENHALDVSVKLMVDKALVPSNVATPHLSKLIKLYIPNGIWSHSWVEWLILNIIHHGQS